MGAPAALGRLLRPTSVAVVGGGAWCENVIQQLRLIGFGGQIWPVHPSRADVGGLPAFAHVDDLPDAPDAAFVGVNRQATIAVMAQLRARGAGGAVCFASGFLEASAELADGAALQQGLIEAAGDMPFLGPNCYGFINALDGAALWPDQHGVVRCDRGVAIVTQSSNIAINMTMQKRGLPLAYVVTAGNQAQTGLAAISMALLDDPRVTALGLHIEGVGDVAAFQALAAKARGLGKPIVALKVGASEQAQVATVSHTASLAGSDAGARALLARLGIAQVADLATFLEALKLLHITGPLASNAIASMSCSGGEASLMADSALGRGLVYPPLGAQQQADLRAALGPKVALANPLDYHTYIWADLPAMTRCFAAMMAPDLALGVVVLDFPRADRCRADDWDSVIAAAAAAQGQRGVPMAILASLPENMPEERCAQIMAAGLVPLCGLPEGLGAIAAAAQLGQAARAPAPPVLPPAAPPVGPTHTLAESAAKAALARHGLDVPRNGPAATPQDAARVAGQLGFPVVLKGTGAAHKTEAGLVALNLADADAVAACATAMQAPGYLVEEMVSGAVAELLVGVVHDPAHGFVLSLAAGGTMTELLQDSVQMLLPVTQDDIRTALGKLRMAPLLAGYRGAPAAHLPAAIAAVLAVQAYALENCQSLCEVEVNPLICTPNRAVAADALITLKGPDR